MTRSVSRRGLLGGGVAAVGAAGALVGLKALDDAAPHSSGVTPASAALAQSHPFHGEHQQGILTPVQDRLHFAAFDVTAPDRETLITLLTAWTQAAERLVQGKSAGPVGPTEGDDRLPPDDTGEAIGLGASRLTLTFGFGPGLFVDANGTDRFGLKDRQPQALRDLPHFPADAMDPARVGGDLCIQACADDPQVAVHAVRNLARIAMDLDAAVVKWSQLGFGRTSSTSTSQATPRNLFGFKDGTASIKSEETADVEKFVWVGNGDDAGAEWMAGGSYLCARRCNQIIETWDRQSLRAQELVTGRTKGSGAPLSGGTEFSEIDLAMPGREGPVVPVDSHVAVVHPTNNKGVRLLRRGYNFVDGNDALGTLNAGLFFIAFVRNPVTMFIPMQTAMAKNDALMEYLKFTGQALFAVPAGTRKGEYVGQALFA